LRKRDYNTGINLDNWIEHFSAMFSIQDAYFSSEIKILSPDYIKELDTHQLRSGKY
jgi:hypothetical protein